MSSPTSPWTTPRDLQDQVQRIWERGKILAAGITGEPLFPLKLTLRRPDPTALGQSFEAVRSWIRNLEENSGFAMLDRLRAAFPNARSLLMDRDTLMAHQSLWVREHTPSRAILSRLEPDELALFDDLVHDRLGENVRLEQERVSYACLGIGLQAVE